MKRAVLAGLVALGIVAVVWAGGDPWKNKPADQWTEQDINDILLNSPWSKPNLQVAGAWHPSGMTEESGNPTMPGGSSDMSHVSAGATSDANGGLEKQDAAAARQATYSIFWWSSRTIRAASMRRAVLKGTMTQADMDKDIAVVPDDIMILVQGSNMQLFQHRGEQAFEKEAYLEIKKSKEKVYPSKVNFLKPGDGQSVTGAIFFFPRKGANGEPTVSPDEKEVDFYLFLGGSKILTYFDPRKMVDSKGEDL
ncbi:MAG TPA: hypothetical protein VMJ93_18710 [Verrucomicrobiae bacterium]|nr:hypothetical protein [Verrucomicrobiae bacterium]